MKQIDFVAKSKKIMNKREIQMAKDITALPLVFPSNIEIEDYNKMFAWLYAYDSLVRDYISKLENIIENSFQHCKENCSGLNKEDFDKIKKLFI